MTIFYFSICPHLVYIKVLNGGIKTGVEVIEEVNNLK